MYSPGDRSRYSLLVICLDSALIDRVMARYPTPIADAAAALLASSSVHEKRDRVVECFRAVMRVSGALALAARVQYGPGPGRDAIDDSEVLSLLKALRKRGLTDGQWVGLTRHLLAPWAASPGAHPIPALVSLFHGSRRAKFIRAIDGLLKMRKLETVAHGATGGVAGIEDVLRRRLPQLSTLLTMTEPMWEHVRLVVPGEAAEQAVSVARDSASAATGSLLVGYTPSRGRWRRVDLSSEVRIESGKPIAVDADGIPRLALAPIAMVRRPSPDAACELFWLDGTRRRRAVYVAFPSMVEHFEDDAWRELERALFGEEVGDEAASESQNTRPYRGLSSFGAKHAELFYGRDRDVETLGNRIRTCGMVTVTGPSGSGKTSLLSAGVLPNFTGFEIVFLRPGSAPMDTLNQRLAGALSLDELDISGDEQPSLAALCRQHGRRVLICVDQVEELFTLCRDPIERNTFAAALARAASDADGPVRVVLSIRGDFFARLATLPALAGRYSRHVEVVTTPAKRALIDILIRPARQFGYDFEDPPLVEAMLAPLAGEPAALAMLQFAADRMWELRDRRWKRMTWDAYEAIGGVEGALAAHADAVLARLNDRQRETARVMLMRLVTAEGTRAVVARRSLIQTAGVGADTVLDHLVDARLVVVRDAVDMDEVESRADARVELIHEALLERWDRLRAWLDEDREYLRIRDRVVVAAANWVREGASADFLLTEGKPLAEAEALLSERIDILQPNEIELIRASQRRRSRRRMWARLAVLFVLVIATVAGLAGLQALREGRRATREAERATREVASRQNAQARANRSTQLARASERAAQASEAEAAARANEAALARARADLARDPTASLAWLRLLDPEQPARREHIFAEARLIAANAFSRGVADQVIAAHESGVTHLAFRPDDVGFASASEDGFIAIWSLRSEERLSLPGHGDAILDLAFSPDGVFLASTGANGTVRVDRTDGTGATPLDGHGGRAVDSLAFAPDGGRLATGGRDQSVLVWEMHTPESPLERFAGFNASVTDVAFSPDGVRLAAADDSGAIRVWNLATSEPIDVAGHDKGVTEIAFSPDGRILASVSRDHSVRIWEFTRGDGRLLGRHERPVQTMRFSTNGRQLVTSGADGSVRVWPLDEQGRTSVLRGHMGTVNDATFVGETGLVVSAGADKTVRVWRPALGEGREQLRVLRGHADKITALAAIPGTDALISGARDGQIRVWRLQGGTEVLVGFEELVLSAAISDDGSMVAGGAGDGVIQIWRRRQAASEALTFERVVRLAEHEGTINQLRFSPDGAHLASAGADGKVLLWDMNERRHRVLDGHLGPVWHVAFSHAGERLVSAGEDATARIWELSSGRSRTLRGHQQAVVHAAFSPDGVHLATASWDHSARIWDTVTGRPVRTLMEHKGPISRVAFSWDSGRLATGSWDRRACVFTIHGALERCLRGHTGEIHDLSFDATGQYLATASADRSVRVWSLDEEQTEATSESVTVLRGHEDEVVSLQFIAGTGRLATASADHTVRLWDMAAGGKSRTLIGHRGEVNQVAVSADGTLLATSSDDRAVRLWREHLPTEPDDLMSWLAQASRAVWDSAGALRSSPLQPEPDDGAVNQ